MRRRLLALCLIVIVSGCAGGPEETPSALAGPSGDTVASAGPTAQTHPDVLSAELVRGDGGTWALSATISSPYDTPERYADAFRAVAPDGTLLGIRELTHDHAAEQPFTRTLTDLAIPDDVDEITVEGRDQANGWGGATVTIPVP